MSASTSIRETPANTQNAASRKPLTRGTKKECGVALVFTQLSCTGINVLNSLIILITAPAQSVTFSTFRAGAWLNIRRARYDGSPRQFQARAGIEHSRCRARGMERDRPRRSVHAP